MLSSKAQGYDVGVRMSQSRGSQTHANMPATLARRAGPDRKLGHQYGREMRSACREITVELRRCFARSSTRVRSCASKSLSQPVRPNSRQLSVNTPLFYLSYLDGSVRVHFYRCRYLPVWDVYIKHFSHSCARCRLMAQCLAVRPENWTALRDVVCFAMAGKGGRVSLWGGKF